MVHTTFVLFFVVGGLLSAFQLAGIVDGEPVAVGWGILITGFSGFMIFHAERIFDVFSPAVLTNFFFVTANGIGLLLSPLDGMGPQTNALEAYEVYYPTVGILVFWTAFFFNLTYISLSNWKITAPKLGREIDFTGIRELKAFWWLFFIFGTSGHIIHAQSGALSRRSFYQDESLALQSASGIMVHGVYVALSVAIIMLIQRKFRSTGWTVKLFATLAIIISITITSASKEKMLYPLIIFAITYNYYYKLINMKQFFAGFFLLLLSFSIIFPINYFHRQSLYALDTKYDYGYLNTIVTFGESVETVASLDSTEYFDLSIDYIWGRSNQNPATSAILRYQDNGGDIQYGKTYASVLFGLIPRFLWPDKPTITLGREIALNVFGLSSSRNTNIGATIVGEAVYNIGSVLSPFIGIVFGLLFKYIYLIFKFYYEKTPELSTVIYTSVWLGFFLPVQGGDFSGPASGAIKWMVLFAIVLLLFQIGKNSRVLR